MTTSGGLLANSSHRTRSLLADSVPNFFLVSGEALQRSRLASPRLDGAGALIDEEIPLSMPAIELIPRFPDGRNGDQACT